MTDQADYSARVAEAMDAANIPSLLAMLVQMTGDMGWMEPPYAVSRGYGIDENDGGGLAPEAAAEVRRAAADAILAWRAGRPLALPDPDEATLVRILSASMGDRVPEDYGPMLAYDLDMVTRGAVSPEPMRLDPPEGFRALVIGAGAGGICAAIRLREAGVPFTLVEQAERVGGVWAANRYPGVGVDTPNHLYSFTFADHDWDRWFVSGAALQSYLASVVDRFGIGDDMRLSTRVRAARWDEGAQLWHVEVEGPGGRETLSANLVIAGSGLFNPPKVPDIPGLGSFAGPCFHTAEWPDGIELAGKRIGVIGAGASAMQSVPVLAPGAAHLTVFQRSPTWAVPFAKLGQEVPESQRFLFREVPLYRAWYRLRLNWIWSDRLLPTLHIDPDWPHPERSLNRTNERYRQVFEDYIRAQAPGREDLWPKLIPAYPPYGKRILLDNGWYRTATRENVAIEDTPIAAIEPGGVRTRDGRLHELDALILATGFDVQRFLSTFETAGRGGRTLREVWGEDEARAYLGVCAPGFPNFFFLYGPNSQTGAGGSIIALLENQVHYVMEVLSGMFARGAGAVECRAEAHDRYNAWLDANLRDMVWTHPGVSTYYRNRKGRVTVNSGVRKLDYWKLTRRADLDDYALTPRPGTAARREAG